VAALAMLTLVLTTVTLYWMVCQSHWDKEDRLGADAPIGDRSTFSLSMAAPLSFFLKVADVAFVAIEGSR
jgi:hypothetical protein